MAAPDRVIQGEFGTELEKGYVLVPFDVPKRVGGKPLTGVRVKYCYDQPELPTGAQLKHTLDLGLYGPREDDERPWGRREFRGWGGSSHPDVTLSPDGFEARDGATTKAFLPGEIEAGKWAAELGVASVVASGEGDTDGKVAWRVEVDLLTDPEFADEPYETTPCRRGGRCSYDPTPARSKPGWYAGDLHVHGEHSATGDAPLEEVFGYAFCPDPRLGDVCEADDTKPGAGLDFVILSDYVGGAQWGEIGRHQPRYPGKLIVPSAEIITYRGHTVAHGITKHVDYRTGPIYLWDEAGAAAREVRVPRPPSGIFDFVHRRRGEPGFTQINHPTIFPSEVPGFDAFCRGCPWDYSDAETDYSKVDAIEIATGPAGLQDASGNPGPNPFTVTAIEFWERAIDVGGLNSNHIAAVGVSDSHNAGRREGAQGQVTQAPIGQATTMVHAPELSARGIRKGVVAGHTYVKIWGTDGPDLRFTATEPGSKRNGGMMGDVVGAERLVLSAEVLNLPQAREARPGTYALSVYRNGDLLETVPIPSQAERFRHEFESDEPGRYRLQVDRTTDGAASIEAVSSPIYHERPAKRGGCRRGSRGKDTMRGKRDADCLKGGPGRDRLLGRAGDDRLFGGRGRDRLGGGPGDDRLRGGGGRDRVRCGSGYDVVLSDGHDRIARDCERVRRG